MKAARLVAVWPCLALEHYSKACGIQDVNVHNSITSPISSREYLFQRSGLMIYFCESGPLDSAIPTF